MPHTSHTINVDQFPIRELSERTGVNSVTLRAWERRYGLLKPFRTSKGHRLYTDVDVERVKRILYWIDQGVSVGKVRGLLEGDNAQETSVQPLATQWLEWQKQFSVAVERLSVGQWERLFLDAVKQYPAPIVIQKGLLPVLANLDNPAEVLYVQASLCELMMGLKAGRKKARQRSPNCLILNLDKQPFSAQLLDWLFSERDESVQTIHGVTQLKELNGLLATLSPQSLLVVGEMLTQTESKRWLELSLSSNVAVTWIGSGFWLEYQQMKESTDRTAQEHYFANTESFTFAL